MEDHQSSYSNCKSATPTKPRTSSNTIHHANPSTKLIQEINHKNNIEKSWNSSLFCTRYLPNPTTVGLSEQNLVEHKDPSWFLYKFSFQRRSSFMFDVENFSGLKDMNKITLHLNDLLCWENGFKIWVPCTSRGGVIIKEFKCNHNCDVQSLSSNVVFIGDSLQQAGTKSRQRKRRKTVHRITPKIPKHPNLH